jgi:hypothetical protein
MVNETSTFIADSDQKIVAVGAILQKFDKRAVVSMDKFTDISTVEAVANEALFKRTLMALGMERCNNSSNCLCSSLVTASSI